MRQVELLEKLERKRMDEGEEDMGLALSWDGGDGIS